MLINCSFYTKKTREKTREKPREKTREKTRVFFKN